MADISLLCGNFRWLRAVFGTDPRAPIAHWRWL